MEHDHHHAAPDMPSGTETAKDPVCGMTVAGKLGIDEVCAGILPEAKKA